MTLLHCPDCGHVHDPAGICHALAPTGLTPCPCQRRPVRRPDDEPLLRELNAEITTVDVGGGTKLTALLFDCPKCGTHSQLQPFGPEQKTIQVGDRTWLIWQQAAGSTVDDLTLRPSFLVASCGLHGYVTAGRWEDC